MIGRRVVRREDLKLVKGQGQYVGDIERAGQLHMAVLRSPHAHAAIRKINTVPASGLAGVVCVLTAQDISDRVHPEPAVGIPADARRPVRPLIADNIVRYVGEPVAVVVAESMNAAIDGCEAIQVDYSPRPAISDGAAALAPDAPLVHEEYPDNVALRHAWSKGDVESAFAEAAHVVALRLVNQRIAPIAMEPRGCLAEYADQTLTVWAGTQTPHRLRAGLAEVLGLPEARIRVIAPDVGGGFGGKIGFYRDELLCAYAAVLLGKPVRLALTRTEDCLTTTQGRGQINEVEVAATADGKILAIRCRTIADLGAYIEAKTPQPPINTGRLITGPYEIQAASYELVCVFSNKMATAPYRGAGRPEATYILERAMDAVARRCGLDPADIRRRNLISPKAFPYTTPSGLVYDSGNYEVALGKALKIVGYDAIRQEQERLREKGRYLGVGMSCFVEHAGLGPGGTGLDAGWEFASVQIDASGKVVLKTGASPHGQGVETALSQIAAARLGIPMEDIEVLHSDTSVIPRGIGTFGSRSMCVGGAAVVEAAEKVIERARHAASDLLEVAAVDLEWAEGAFQIRGVPEKSLSLRKIAAAVGELADSTEWQPQAFTFPSGTHVAVVEVDIETGMVRLRRIIAVDDCGTIINPMIVEGQVHGGLTQGIGQAMCEHMLYDDSGQCTTATFMDYSLPRAGDLPSFELGELETASPVNSLGAKGCGETGTIGIPPAVVNAVIDALHPFGVTHLDMPITTATVWQALRNTRQVMDIESGC